MGNNSVHVKISRYSPENNDARIEEFEVPYTKGMTVQTMLRYIHENLDPTLAFRDFRCGQGVCNTCRVRVNNKTIRSCETLIHPGEEALFEPAPGKVIRDLVIQFD